MRTAIDALLGQIDPYTEYFSIDERDNITSVTTGEYAGIGSVIQRRDSVVVLTAPSWNSPARRAGGPAARPAPCICPTNCKAPG